MCIIYNISLEEPWHLSLPGVWANGQKVSQRENVGEGSGASPASTWHVMLRTGQPQFAPTYIGVLFSANVNHGRKKIFVIVASPVEW